MKAAAPDAHRSDNFLAWFFVLVWGTGYIATKTGIMVGLGEEEPELSSLFDDLRRVGVSILTIGQYLQPTRKHHPVVRFVPPDEFKALETIAYSKGFLMVSASPLTRSSYHAGDDFARLKAARNAR